MARCKDCRHWNKDGFKEEYYMEEELGVCDRMKPFWDAYEWNESYERYVLKDETSLAWVTDKSQYWADLITRGGFSCVSFEKGEYDDPS